VRELGGGYLWYKMILSDCGRPETWVGVQAKNNGGQLGRGQLLDVMGKS